MILWRGRHWRRDLAVAMFRPSRERDGVGMGVGVSVVVVLRRAGVGAWAALAARPLVSGGVWGGDGKINVRGAAGVAGGAGAEETHFAHAREAAKGAAEHGEILVAKREGFHLFSPISGLEFYPPCHQAGERSPGRCAGFSVGRGPPHSCPCRSR